MQLPPEVAYWEPRIVVTLVAFILVRALFGASRSGAAAWYHAFAAVALTGLLSWFAQRGAATHPKLSFLGFALFALLGGIFFARKYAIFRGVIFLQEWSRRQGTFSREVGPADVVLPALILFIGCIARAGLSAIWIASAWGVVIAATGIGLFYYSRVQHDLWAGELSVGSYEPFQRLRPGYVHSPPSKKNRDSAGGFDFAGFVLRLTDCVFLLIAYAGVPLVLAYAVPVSWSKWAAAAAILAAVVPIVYFRLKAAAIARRAARAFVHLIAGVTANDPRAMAAALAESPHIEKWGRESVEVLIERSPGSLEEVVKAFEEGNGHEAMIEVLWKEGYVHPAQPAGGEKKIENLQRMTELLRIKKCPARQRGVLLGYMLQDMDGGAQSLFIGAHPDVFADSELMHHLERAHGITLVKQS